MNGTAAQALEFGRWTLDARTRQLALDGKMQDLGERAFDLLAIATSVVQVMSYGARKLSLGAPTARPSQGSAAR